MKKIKSSVLSIGNNNFVKVEIKGNKNEGLFAFYVNSKRVAVSVSLSKIKSMYDSWLFASEEQRQHAKEVLNSKSFVEV